MPNPPITARERKALNIFLAEREALFALLEHDRLTPLSEATAHRGRAAIAGALRLLPNTGGKPAAPLPETGPLLPVELFLALCQVGLSLESQFRERPQSLAKIYPRSLAEA